MTYSSCLHNQQDLCWGNTSRDTSEESQESQSQIIVSSWIVTEMGDKIQRAANMLEEASKLLREGKNLC